MRVSDLISSEQGALLVNKALACTPAHHSATRCTMLYRAGGSSRHPASGRLDPTRQRGVLVTLSREEADSRLELLGTALAQVIFLFPKHVGSLSVTHGSRKWSSEVGEG